MIRQLSLEGLKGQFASYNLQKLNLLTGPNGTGKTAALQAAMVGVLGYEPRLGKTPGATLTLASDGRMSVELVTEDGFGVTREFAFDPARKSASQRIILHGQEEMRQQDAEAIIAERLGNFPVMFDLDEFTSLSPDKQRDFIFKLSRMDEKWSPGLLLNHLMLRTIGKKVGEAVITTTLEMKYGVEPKVEAFNGLSDEQQQECVELLIGKLNRVYANTLRAVLADLRKHCTDDIQGSLAGMIAALKAWAKAAKAKKAESEAAIRGLTEEKNVCESEVGGIAELKKELEEASAEYARLREDARADEEKRKAHEQRIADAQAAVQRHEDTLTVKRKELKDMQAARMREGEATSTLDADVVEKKKALEGLPADDSDEQIECIEDRLNANRQKQGVVDTELFALKSADKIHKELLKKEQAKFKVFESGKCPTCGTPVESEHIKTLLAKMRADMQRWKAGLKSSAESCKQRQAALNGLKEEERGLVEELRAMKKKAAVTIEKQGQVAREIQDMEIDLARREAAEKARAKGIRLLKAEISLMQADPPPPAPKPEPMADPTVREKQIHALTEKVESLKAVLESKHRAQGLLESIGNRLVRAQMGSVEHDVVKDMVEAVKGVRDQLVKEIIGPLQGTVDDLLAEIDPRYKVYFRLEDDRGKPSFDFGWQIFQANRQVSHRIPFKSLSGGESVLFSAAIATALILRAAPPEKMLLLEMGELDDHNAALLLKGLNKLSRHLDNIVAVSCHDVKVPDGWQVFNLGEVA